MAMRYEYKGDFEKLSENVKGFVHTELPMLMMICGIGNLTSDTIDELIYRCKQGLIEEHNWRELIGNFNASMPFHCNVKTESRIDWYKRTEQISVKKFNKTWANNQKMEVR